MKRQLDAVAVPVMSGVEEDGISGAAGA